jgi:beta-galactosidase
VVLNVGTAALPPWLLKKMPEAEALGQDGRPYPGKRLRGSVSAAMYALYAEKLTNALARRYGDNLGVAGWIVPVPPEWDYGPATRKAFQAFMKNAASLSLDTLNHRWASKTTGVVYSDWDEIRLPTKGTAPAAWQDFAHMQGKLSEAYMKAQLTTLQRFTTDQFICPSYPLSDVSGPLACSVIQGQNISAISQLSDLPTRGSLGQFALGQAFCRGQEPTAHVSLPIGNGLTLPKPGEVKRMLWHQFALGARFVCLKSEGRLGGIVEPDGQTLTRVAQEVKETLIDFDVLHSMLAQTASMPFGIARQTTGILLNPDEVAAAAQGDSPIEDYVRIAFSITQNLGCPMRFLRSAKDLNPAEVPFLLIPAFASASGIEISQWKRYAERGGHLLLWPGVGLQSAPGKMLGSALWPILRFKIEEVYVPQPGDSSYVSLGALFPAMTSEILAISPEDEDSIRVVGRYATPEYKGKPAILSARHGAGVVVYAGTTSSDGSLEQKLFTDLLTSAKATPPTMPDGVYAAWNKGLWVVVNSSPTAYIPPATIFPRDRVIGIGPTVLPGAVGVYKWGK